MEFTLDLALRLYEEKQSSETIDYNHYYCVYLSTHPSGWFYGGKGATDSVLKGKYKGSGVLVSNLFKKYPKKEWATVVLSTFLTEDEAYDSEALLVTKEFVALDHCANIDTGGRHTTRHEDTKAQIGRTLKETRAKEDKLKIHESYVEARNRPEEKAQRAQSVREAKASPEYREFMSEVAKEALNRPEVVEKLRKSSTEMWQDPIIREKRNTARIAACGDEWRAKMVIAGMGKSHKTIKVEVDGVVYKSRRSACIALDKHPKQLKRDPTYKEL